MRIGRNHLLKALLWPPTLGGWLAILHALFCLLALSPMVRWPPYFNVVAPSFWLSCVLLLPFKATFFGRYLFGPEEVPMFFVAATVDSLVWGYGLGMVCRPVLRRLWTVSRNTVFHKRRLRFSLRTLLLLPLAVAAFLVLANPRIITGHFCYITVDQLITTEEGKLFVKYSQYASPGVVTHPCVGETRAQCFYFAGGWAGTRSGAFRWYARNSHSFVGRVNLVRLGLESADWRSAMRVDVGETYRVELGSRLYLYGIPDPQFVNRCHKGYIEVDEF